MHPDEPLPDSISHLYSNISKKEDSPSVDEVDCSEEHENVEVNGAENRLDKSVENSSTFGVALMNRDAQQQFSLNKEKSSDACMETKDVSNSVPFKKQSNACSVEVNKAELLLKHKKSSVNNLIAAFEGKQNVPDCSPVPSIHSKELESGACSGSPTETLPTSCSGEEECHFSKTLACNGSSDAKTSIESVSEQIHMPSIPRSFEVPENIAFSKALSESSSGNNSLCLSKDSIDSAVYVGGDHYNSNDTAKDDKMPLSMTHWHSETCDSPPCSADIDVLSTIKRRENKLNQSMPDLVSSANYNQNSNQSHKLTPSPKKETFSTSDCSTKNIIQSDTKELSKDGAGGECLSSDSISTKSNELEKRDDKMLANMLLLFFVTSIAVLYLFPVST